MTGQFTAAANKREGHTHVLLITTGSVASIKAPLIVEELLKVSNYPRKLPHRSAQLGSFPAHTGDFLPLFFFFCFPNPAPRPRPRPLASASTVQGRISAGGRDQAVSHVLPTG